MFSIYRVRQKILECKDSKNITVNQIYLRIQKLSSFIMLKRMTRKTQTNR